MKMQSTRRNPVSSASTVASDIDLLTEILLLLPVKSLIPFKLVSKRWLSLISSSNFSARHSRIYFNTIPTGIFLSHSLLLFNPLQQPPPNGESISLLSDEIPLNPLHMAFSFVSKPCNIQIQQSCNGLLLFFSYCSDTTETDTQDYFVLNPTTKQSRSIPKLMDDSNSVIRGEDIRGMALAFDPSKSPHYRVVCVHVAKESTTIDDSELLVIEIFSPETSSWRVCGESFLAGPDDQFEDAVFFNGYIFWVGYGDGSLYFNVEEERLHTLRMSPTYNEMGEEMVNGGNGSIRHFGECCGHLNLIEIYQSPITKFNIYELETSSLTWFVKYRVDVGHVVAALEDDVGYYSPDEWDYYNCGVLSVVQGEKDEDMFLVLHINGKLVRYNSGDGSFTKLCDVDDHHLFGSYRFGYSGAWLSHLPFIESLACV